METLNQKNAKVRKLQLAELSILKEVRDFCDERGIVYYLAFGSLLGAVRHQGFIPWDDDVDVFMMRPDYERFLQTAKELPDHLFVRTYRNSRLGEENIVLQTKVEEKNRFVIRETSGKKIRQRIWIDIFPVDGMPKTGLIRELHWMNIRFHYNMCRIARSGVGHREGPRPFLEKAVLFICDHTSIRDYLSLDKAFSRLDRTVGKYTVDHGPLVLGFADRYGRKTIIPGCCFGRGKTVIFEGESFRAPDDTDTLLRSWYGDYMQLPPPEEQVASHCIDIIDE